MHRHGIETNKLNQFADVVQLLRSWRIKGVLETQNKADYKTI